MGGRCPHHSLLLAELGLLPDATATPVPWPAPARCPGGGTGIEPDFAGPDTAAGGVWCECSACGPDARPTPIAA